MYTLAGITFYDNNDSDEVIAKAYDKMKTRSLIEAGYEIDEFPDLSGEVEYMLKKSRTSLIHAINMANSQKMMSEHEQHWIQFLECFGFEAEVVEYNMTMMLGVANISGVDIFQDKVINGLYTLHGHRYLKICTTSRVQNDHGENLILSAHFVHQMLSLFKGSNVYGAYLYIKYCPAIDIYSTLVLTRMLHLLL